MHDYVRSKLQELGMECTDPIREPDLLDLPVFSFIASPKEDLPLTALEMQSIFEKDKKIEVAFET